MSRFFLLFSVEKKKKGKKGDARWAIFMVPSDMVERTEPYGICECQPQPQQFATLATLKKPSVIHYVVMSYIDYCRNIKMYLTLRKNASGINIKNPQKSFLGSIA